MNGTSNAGFKPEDVDESIELDGSIMILEAPAGNENHVEKTPAIVVRQAYKSFGSTHVLKNYNMTVTEGTIYSLLGSSGCGKTTILSAIVGLRRLDSGHLSVFGEIPGTAACGIPGPCVGHMPQDHALHPYLSIQESFDYYGLIYEMSSSRIKERSEFLLKFLNLPKPSQKIITLSGGQKRRVSLAIAMIHEPKLLILDEPTVGVDQLLRESIWNLLKNLIAESKTTILITTHYIEEARCSSTIGVMRNGRLLAEQNPSELLEQYNATLLEEIVLILSRKDDEIDGNEEMASGNHNSAVPTIKATSKPESETYMHNRNGVLNTNINSKFQPENGPIKNKTVVPKKVSLNHIRAVARKSCIFLIRNHLLVWYHILAPAFQIGIICLAIGNDPKNLKFGVVNHESPTSSIQAFTTPTINDSQCGSNDWGNKFIDELPNNDILILIPFETDDEAIMAARKGYTWGYLSIPSNFSSDLQERMLSGLFITNESYEGSTITLQLDMSSQTIGVVLQRVFFTTFQNFAANLLTACNYDPRTSELPLKFKEPLFGSAETSFREYLAPSSLLGLLFFFPLCSSSVNYIREKKAGTLDRALVAGVTTFEVMVANLITEVLVLLIQSSISFLLLSQMFMIEVQGHILTAVCLCVVVGIAGMSMGFLISTFCDEEIHAIIIAMGFFLPNFLLAGMVWPVEGMPMFLQYLSYLLPCTLACESMRSIITRGWSVLHYRVYSGFISTLAWTVIYWIVTIFIHKRLNKNR